MKMKKLIALLLALTLCLALFSACGNNSNSSDGPTNANNNTSGSNNNTGGDGSGTSTGKAEYTLVVVNHDSAASLGEQWLETVLNSIKEESGGRVDFQYYAGGSMYGATETIDAVADGGADICWFTTGTYGGIFPISEFINLVGNGVDSAQFGSAVLNTMYNEIPEVAAEYSRWHVLAVHGTSTSPISTVGKKIESPADLQGLQLRTAGTIPTIYVNNLGATATSMPTSDVYDSLAKKVIDGMCNDWHNIDCFKLYEPIDYCLNVNLNETASGVLMNQATWDRLPEDIQAIFNKYFASYYAADMAGYYWDSCRYWVADEMRENKVEVYEPTDEVYNYLFSDEIISATHQAYIEYLNGKGIDGQAMYNKCMEIVARYADDYAHVWDSEFNYSEWDKTPDGYQAIYG